MKTKVEDLSIDDVEIFSNETNEGMYLSWSANIGFGEVKIFREKGTEMWRADTERMCSNDDKEFLRMVLNAWVDQMEIEG